jgi:hypothetical protein
MLGDRRQAHQELLDLYHNQCIRCGISAAALFLRQLREAMQSIGCRNPSLSTYRFRSP